MKFEGSPVARLRLRLEEADPPEKVMDEAQRDLNLSDGGADGGLGDVQLFRGGGEGAKPGRRFEDGEVVGGVKEAVQVGHGSGSGADCSRRNVRNPDFWIQVNDRLRAAISITLLI